jgi:hypothetical protein
MIPEDWEVVELGSLGDFRNGINFNRNDLLPLPQRQISSINITQITVTTAAVTTKMFSISSNT